LGLVVEKNIEPNRRDLRKEKMKHAIYGVEPEESEGLADFEADIALKEDNVQGRIGRVRCAEWSRRIGGDHIRFFMQHKCSQQKNC